MAQETLEEVAERLVPEAGCELNNSEALYWQQGWISGHIEGAKWQQERMYSEEDMIEFGKFCHKDANSVNRLTTFKELFEQFKKKQNDKQ